MKKIILEIEGMACSMCEAHVNEAIRRAVPSAKKVSSSHKRGECSFVTEEAVSEETVRRAMDQIGYGFRGMRVEEYVKKGLFG